VNGLAAHEHSISLADYYSTIGARVLAHRVKENHLYSVLKMARGMAKKAATEWSQNCVLIPVPSSHGYATNTRLMALVISEIAVIPMLNIVRGRARERLYDAKIKGGRGITKEFFGFHLVGSAGIRTPVLIDSVFDTGRTTQAVAGLFHKPVIIFTHSRVQHHD
jgi:predicted amidophosphoribosyltransferase